MNRAMIRRLAEHMVTEYSKLNPNKF